jgi:membrane-associated phospholipid phosphatase
MRDPHAAATDQKARSNVVALREHRAAAEFARTISTIFNPFLTATALFIIVSHAFAHHSTLQFWVYSTVGVLCFTVAPLTFVLGLYLTGRISDFDMSERPERERVFAGFVVIYLIAALSLSLAHAPIQLQAITWGYWGTALATMVITRWWKISTHAFGIAGPFAAMFVLFNFQPLPYVALVPLVGWARVYLHSHTIAQVLGGAALAVANTVIFFRLFHLL